MAVLIILGGVYAAALFGVRRLGGFAAVAEGLREWGCRASDVRRQQSTSRSF
jgi:hypothetical protein